ncbi:MAG: SDR family NAD(P)-dependent oxidoreductase [Clostridiales bacterium]|nr:SDR family NAD(P)-dependent oxidoreductase [Clostridiales bacterium]
MENQKLRVAVVTGASSGMGAEFARRICMDASFDFDEIWLIARREVRLADLAKELPKPTRTLTLDLTDSISYKAFALALEINHAEVTLLIKAAGFGIFAHATEIDFQTQLDMIDVNTKALTALTALCIPCMEKGAAILNMCSLSSFQPVPYINVYAATKAYVLSYSRALGVELRPRGVRVMAVCPGWVATEFFDIAEKDHPGAVPNKKPLWTAAQVITKALKDFKRGRELSILGFGVRAQALLVKLLPYRLVMRIWMAQQGMARNR